MREPLTLWKDHGVLVDGHHRKRVLDEHPEIPFTIDEIEFADEDAVDEWIIKNQLGKHNLTEPQMTVLRGLLYKQRMKTAGNSTSGRDNSGRFQTVQNELNGKSTNITRHAVAMETGVGEATIERAKQVVEGLERADKVDPTLREDYLSGKVKANKQDIAAIRKLGSDEEVKAAIEEIRNPTVSKVTSRTSGSKDQRIFNERLNAISAEMEKPKGGYTLDDAVRDLNSAEDVFLNQIEFILRARKSILDADERTKEALTGYIESVIHDLEELKGRF